MPDDVPVLTALRRYDPQLTAGAVDQWLDQAAEPAVMAWLATWPQDQRQLVELLLKERRQRDRGAAEAQRAIDRLRRAASTMAVNAEGAARAGLEGDARRWRVVRGDVVAALELFGAPTEADAAGSHADELKDDLMALEYEARGAVIRTEDREFFARAARRAWDRIRQLEQEVARLGEDGPTGAGASPSTPPPGHGPDGGGDT